MGLPHTSHIFSFLGEIPPEVVYAVCDISNGKEISSDLKSDWIVVTWCFTQSSGMVHLGMDSMSSLTLAFFSEAWLEQWGSRFRAKPSKSFPHEKPKSQVPSHELQTQSNQYMLSQHHSESVLQTWGLSTGHRPPATGSLRTILGPMSLRLGRSRWPWLPLATLLLGLCFTGPQASRPSRPFRTCLRAADEAWREAYDMELQRNQLLREQLKKEDMKLPEVCEVDWKANYEMLVDIFLSMGRMT